MSIVVGYSSQIKRPQVRRTRSSGVQLHHSASLLLHLQASAVVSDHADPVVFALQRLLKDNPTLRFLLLLIVVDQQPGLLAQLHGVIILQDIFRGQFDCGCGPPEHFCGRSWCSDLVCLSGACVQYRVWQCLFCNRVWVEIVVGELCPECEQSQMFSLFEAILLCVLLLRVVAC